MRYPSRVFAFISPIISNFSYFSKKRGVGDWLATQSPPPPPHTPFSFSPPSVFCLRTTLFSFGVKKPPPHDIKILQKRGVPQKKALAGV